MSLLWETSPLSSYRIAEQLSESTGWNPKTVKTLLSRLVKKGFLNYEKEANRYLYYPTVSRRESIRHESRSFVDRIFRGDAASMLLHFVEETELSDEQRDELRQLLDRMDGSPEDEP
ncbi:MAG: BlaI/MecI/CopY family transcriptional regulator [Thermoanaerobaculia bacterium]|nr:BlaI/MecI/CopY family transcriptional regulator [Thermoanaerobaculia bacterium]